MYGIHAEMLCLLPHSMSLTRRKPSPLQSTHLSPIAWAGSYIRILIGHTNSSQRRACARREAVGLDDFPTAYSHTTYYSRTSVREYPTGIRLFCERNTCESSKEHSQSDVQLSCHLC
jgi:hypothetical protein